MLRRLLPFTLLVGAGGAVSGLIRGIGLFLPGLAGLAGGALLGWLAGRIARGDPEENDSFGLRVGLALGTAALWATAGAVTVSLMKAGPGDGPLGWLSGVLSGHGGELFYGFSRNSFQSVSGLLAGAWWIGFAALDSLLFAALFLVSYGAGVSPDENELEGEEEDEGGGSEAEQAAIAGADETGLEAAPAAGAEEDHDAVEALSRESSEPSDSPGGPPVDRHPGGLLVFAFLAVVSAAILVLPHELWARRTAPATGADARAMASAIAGRWVFGPGAPFLGSGEEERTFTLVPGSRGKLAGTGQGAGSYLLTLEPRCEGTFTGRLVIPGTAAHDLLVRPAEDGETLHFTLSRPTEAGPGHWTVTAHR